MHAHFKGKFGQKLAGEEKRAAETKSGVLAQYRLDHGSTMVARWLEPDF